MSDHLFAPPVRKPWHRHIETIGSITAITVLEQCRESEVDGRALLEVRACELSPGSDL